MILILLFSFQFTGLDTVKINNENYLQLRFQNAGEYKVVGNPLLPVITKLVPVEPNTVSRLNIKSGVSKKIKLSLPVLPAQPSIPKIPGATVEFKKNVGLYNTDAYYPGKLGEIVDTVYIRSIPYLVVNLYPVQYNPVKESLLVYEDLNFSITSSGGSKSETNEIIRKYSNRYFPPPTNTSVSKFSFLSAPVRYMIITPDRFFGLLDSFIQWKQNKGFLVDAHTISEIGGGDTASVRNFIQSAYDTSAVPPSFVLLIGDTADIECWIGTETDNPPTDLYYSTLSGADYFPDIYVGRISASDSQDISGTLNKIVTYERNLWSVPSDWLNKIYFIASKDSDGHTIAESTHTYCMRKVRAAGMLADSLFLYDSYGGTSINTALTDGRVWITYSGHGNETSWAEIPYDVSDVNNLSNPDMNPLILSFACLTGNFAYEESFGEAWIRNGQNAGIGFIGSSVYSYWGEDDVLQRRMFDEAFDSSQTFLGGMLDKGKRDLYEYYGGIGNSKRYFEQYNLLGDPALDVYTSIPDTPYVSYPNPIPTGNIPVDFYVSLNGNPVNNALISVHTTNSVYSGFTDNGAMEFNIQTTIPETANIYLTGHNLYPLEATLVVTDTTAYLALDSIIVSDYLGNNNRKPNPQESLLVYPMITNEGNDTVFAASIIISSHDTISTIIQNSAYIDTILPQQPYVSSPFKVYIHPNIQDSSFAYFQIDITDTTNHHWIFYPKLNIFSSKILYQDYFVCDSLGYFQPGDSVDWAVQIMKTGRELAKNVQGTISTSSPYIIQIDSTTLWDSLPRDSTVNNVLSPFIIKISSSTPIPTIIPASLILQWDIYTDTLNFSIFVGKKDYFIWDCDKNHNSGPVIDSILKQLGYFGDYSTSFTSYPDIYKSIFICAGIYSYNYLIPDGSSEAKQIVDYLSKGNRVYMEGGDVWFYDPLYNGGFDFRPYFGLSSVDDGTSIDSVIGVTGLPTENMRFGYGGDNQYIDNIKPDTNGAVQAFTTTSSNYGVMVAFDNSVWKTVASSFEFGGLQDGVTPSTKDSLLSMIMNFFNSPSGISIGKKTRVLKFECSAFPNPFINNLRILYTLPSSGDVKIQIFDILGRNVYNKRISKVSTGIHKFIWRGKSSKNNGLPEGIYFLRISFKDKIFNKKVILLK